MGAVASIAIFDLAALRKIKVDHPSITTRRSSTMP
jgi:hypothetical protein